MQGVGVPPRNPMECAFFGYGVGSVAMEHAEIELFLCCEMPHTGHTRLPERPIIGPCGKDFVDRCVMNGRLTLGVVRYG